MNASQFNAGAFDASTALPLWLPPVPARTDSRAPDERSFTVPYLPRLVIQPGDVRDYDLDFREVIPTHDDPVTTATVSVEPAGLDVDCVVVDGRVKVWLAGGDAGCKHKVTAVAHTAGGRAHEADLRVRVKDL